MSTYPELRWKPISHEAWSCLYISLGGPDKLKLFGTVSDMAGQYGTPIMLTEWGPKDADFPLIKIEENPKTKESKFFVAYWREEHP